MEHRNARAFIYLADIGMHSRRCFVVHQASSPMHLLSQTKGRAVAGNHQAMQGTLVYV